MALVFAQLGERRLRAGIAALLDRRLVAPHALRRFLQKGPQNITAASACESAASSLRELFGTSRGGFAQFLNDGPIHHPQFKMLAEDLRRLCGDAALKGCATSGAQGDATSGAKGDATAAEMWRRASALRIDNRKRPFAPLWIVCAPIS